MKTKYMRVLLLIFVFAGVFVLSNTSARADWARSCSDTADGECATFGGVWSLKAFVGFEPGGKNEIPVELGMNWPVCDSANSQVIFRYIAGPTDPTLKSKSALSYLVYDWYTNPLPDGTPTGGLIDISQFESLFYGCCTNCLEPGDLAYKVNASVNNKSDAIIEIRMPLGTGVNEDGHAWMKWSSDCDDGTIWTAQAGVVGGQIPQASTTIFSNCGTNNSVTVKFNVCGYVESVTCGTGSAQYQPAAELRYTYDPPEDTSRDFTLISPIPNIGPRTGGVAICTDPPVYVYGRRAWFCPEP
jgi:hypothetical protein